MEKNYQIIIYLNVTLVTTIMLIIEYFITNLVHILTDREHRF